MTVHTPIIEEDAATDIFKKILTPFRQFTIDAKVSGVLTGLPTWTLLVSNFDGSETDFKEYSPETTDMAITTAIESDKLNFKYIAIKYNSNGSTGLISFIIVEQ